MFVKKQVRGFETLAWSNIQGTRERERLDALSAQGNGDADEGQPTGGEGSAEQGRDSINDGE